MIRTEQVQRCVFDRIGLGSVDVPPCRCSLPAHKEREVKETEEEVKGLSRFF